MRSGYEIRATKPDEYRATAGAVYPSLLTSPPSDERWEKYGYRWNGTATYSAWDRERCVGGASYSFLDTVVPGGAMLATGAVARVGVLPTHRRQGLARGLMNALIDDAAERGVTLLSLRASEAPIYTNFGFGLAGEDAAVTIDPGRARPLTLPVEPNVFRMLAGEEILPAVQSVYGRWLGRHPGQITRPQNFWNRYYESAIEQKDGSFVVAHLDERGDIDGVVQYALRWAEENPRAGGAGTIGDIIASSKATELALWQFLLDIDLVTAWTADGRPLDDLVKDVMADRRAYQVTAIQDEQWLRIIDVGSALAARTYNQTKASVTLAVSDDRLDANNGVWRISSDGAERLANQAVGDLAVDIGGLSALYLGRPSWAAQGAVGKVRYTAEETLDSADALFSTITSPYCGSFF